MEAKQGYERASISTADDLLTVARGISITDEELSEISLPELENVVKMISRLVPAGNVPGLILGGLARLRAAPSQKNVKRDVHLLLRGVDQMLDQAVFSTFFAGPAAVIWAYQKLLQMTGKSIDEAFPQGAWQFYVDYALREDTARHTHETQGFDTTLHTMDVSLALIDRMAAWVLSAVHTLHNYDALLKNEWRERVYLRLLRELDLDPALQAQIITADRNWQAQVPYRRNKTGHTDESYPLYRQRRFDKFLLQFLSQLPAEQKCLWRQRSKEAKHAELAAFQQQLSILAYLQPDVYNEERIPIPLQQAHVGVIYQGRYYLVPAYDEARCGPVSLGTVRAQIAALVNFPARGAAAQLTQFATIQRAQWPLLRRQLPTGFIKQLDMLHLAPIWLNFDKRPRELPLTELRQAERAIGDHALTIFDTGTSFAFDLSHIFFDGAWGAALAEIMTNEAVYWARQLLKYTPAEAAAQRPYSPPLQLQERYRKKVNEFEQVHPETTAETSSIDLKAILDLRRLFKKRSDLLQLTVNDLLLLYRAVHAVSYQPDSGLRLALEQLADKPKTRAAAHLALQAIQPGPTCPAILLPVDARRHSPRDRLYPMSLEVPLQELDLLDLHHAVMNALMIYENTPRSRRQAYQNFDTLQRSYLTALAGFGTLMTQAKAIANRGETASVHTIKLLAHMPQPLQRALDSIPQRFDVLNDIIKGREVFSNIGAAADESSLTRFSTAKDDNEKKSLAWGILTDSKGVMRISLRDFRPHVRALIAVGEQGTAQMLTQHYLFTYAQGLNAYVRDVQQITAQSRETQLA